jgi:two-component system LytT family sensor kinase
MLQSSIHSETTLISFNQLWKGWIHGLFWVSYFLFEWLNTGAFLGCFNQSFFSISLNLPILIIAAYWHLFVTVRAYLLKGKMTGFWLNLLGGFVIFGYIRRYISYTYYFPVYHTEGLKQPLIYLPKILYETMQIHLVVALFVVVELIRYAIRQHHLSEIYKREKLTTEYNLLHSQVQPHFLFNTLNNLVSVSIHKPKQMPHLLQRLAGLLSYQLHESSLVKVPISKEIEYLKNYIALEKIRYGERLDVQTNFHVWNESQDFLIPPMLLLPFVENAFKHGASLIEKDCWIRVNLELHGQRIIFTVENSIPENADQVISTGLGLNNLRRRLDILLPNNYELITMPEMNQFLAVLKFKIE